MVNIVLVEPEIPQNCGNIARTCAATRSRLHLVEPLGFDISEKAVRRAGLDYWPMVDLQVYHSLEDLFARNPDPDLWLATTKAPRDYTAAQFRDAHGGLVAMRVGLVCFFTQCLNGLRRRGHVGASDSQADDVLAFRVHAGHFFEFHREIVLFHGGQPVGRPYVRVKLSVFHLDILLKF